MSGRRCVYTKQNIDDGDDYISQVVCKISMGYEKQLPCLLII